MKPAPFEKTRQEPVNNTPFIVMTDPETNETSILKKDTKDLVWKMKEFIGRKVVYVSPNGSELVAFGNLYFGGLINTSNDPDIAIIYKNGNLSKKVVFTDIYGEKIAKITAEKKLPVKGGGWVSLGDFITHVDVDWSKRTMTFSLPGKPGKALPF